MFILQIIIEISNLVSTKLNAFLPLWIILSLGILFTLVILWFTFEHSRFRGAFTSLIHLAVIIFGWFLGKWTGILWISIPLLAFCYYLLLHIALVVIPASEPNNKREWFQRVRYFFWYIWGFQFPGWAVTDSAGRDAEIRIKGDQYKSWCSPGLVWAHSHQVVGLTTGINFSRIVAPGTVFTKPFEQPFVGIVDLRPQSRTIWIDVVSSDAIPYKARLSASFVVDNEKWDRKLFPRLYQENRLLKDAREPDYTEGSFPISRLRIRTLLSTTGIFSSVNKPSVPKTTYWDEMVMYHIEKAASEVLSQRRFDELWLPADDHAGACAGDDIADAIRNLYSFNLLCRGVRLFSCRLVDFEFSREKVEEPGEVERQQIATWRADWQRDAVEIRAQGKAEAELLQQEGRAFAYATLLTAVAEGLREEHLRQPHPDLPRHLVAMRFIGALEEMLQQQPEGDGKSEAATAINNLKKLIPPDKTRE